MGRYSPNLIKRVAYATASAAFPAGTAPRLISGKSVLMDYVATGTLSARVTGAARTNTLTVSARWQVSFNNSDWLEIAASPNNPANVVLATGTGSDGAFDRVLPAPDGVYAYPYARIQLYTGVGSADGTNDLGATSYNYREVE